MASTEQSVPGVTRVARVTGLDRTQVEVACAIRPEGHVLQVANGKGLTFERARASALAEAAELWAAEQVDPLELRWASLRDFAARGWAAWGPLSLGSAGACVVPELWSDTLRCAWRPAEDLVAGRTVWIPAQALHCLRAGDWPLGPQLVRWTTNGMGAHPHRARALLHALLEATERHQLAQALPDGWTEPIVRARRLDVSGAKRTRALVERLRARGFEACLFDLAPKKGIALATCGALLFDQERGPVPLTAGYACALDADDAMLRALLEAAQSRLTDVHGAREDVAPADRDAAEWLQRVCAKARASRQVSALPTTRGGWRAVVRALQRAGHRQIAAATLTPRRSAWQVVKVVVPSFQVSELL